MVFVSFDEAVTAGGRLRKNYKQQIHKNGRVSYYKVDNNKIDDIQKQPKKKPKKNNKPVFKVEKVITIIDFD